jgi:hypothetical protein
LKPHGAGEPRLTSRVSADRWSTQIHCRTGAGVRIRLTRRGGARGIEPFDLLPLRLAVGYGLNERSVGYGLNDGSGGWREDPADAEGRGTRD